MPLSFILYPLSLISHLSQSVLEIPRRSVGGKELSGHSHWSSIKHKKGAVDAKRGKMFSKLAKNVTSAARQGGGDLDANLTLKYAVDKAKAVNMPKDTIERAIKKGTGELPGEELFELRYEGYGSGGVALMVDVVTDNRNRTASEIRRLFENGGGNLGQSGCVSWMFEQKGLFVVQDGKTTEDELMEIVVDAGAEDLEAEGTMMEVTCDPGDFESVKQAITSAEIEPELAEISQVPKSDVEVSEKDGRKILSLMDKLEDHEDVQNVYANFKLPPALVEELQAEE